MLLAQSALSRARITWTVERYACLALSLSVVWMRACGACAGQEPGTAVPPELKPYVDARSVVSQPQAELIKQYTELEDVAFAQPQEQLPFLLARIGEAVDAFFRDFVNVTSTETISQEIESSRAVPQLLGSVWQEMRGPRTIPKVLQHRCNYLIAARRDEKGIALEEYRTNNDGAPIDLSSSYLVTSGFVSSPLFFHPRYQTGSLFRHLGRERKGRRFQVLAFAQRPETAELIGSFHLAGGPAVILTQGIAWVDPDSFQIVRMRTDLLAPRPDIWLGKQASEIEFEEVSFEGVPRPLRLPRKVEVTIDWQHSIYRNQHHYKNYKLFSVETREDSKEIVRPRGQGT